MSVINKALSELDKREKGNGAQYGKYVPPERKSSLTPALAGAGIMAALAVVAIGGYWYFASGKSPAPAAAPVAETISAEPAPAAGGNESPEPEKTAEIAAAGSAAVTPADQDASGETADSIELRLMAEGAMNQETSGETVLPPDGETATGTVAVDEPSRNKPVSREQAGKNEAGQNSGGKNQAGKKTTPPPVTPAPEKKTPKSPDRSAERVDQTVQISDIAAPEIIIDDNAPENFVIVEEARAPARRSSSMRVKQKNLSPKEEADLLRKEAQNSLLRGDSDGAIRSYEVLLKKNPGDAKAREKLASLYYGKGRSLDAIKTLDRGILMDPAHYDYRLYLARIYSSQGQDAQAIKVLRQANPPARGNMDYYATLAGLARKNNDHAGAAWAYEKLAQAEKKDGKWYLGLAISLEELGRPGDALNAYRKAAALYLSVQSRSFAEQRIGVLGGKK